MAATSSLSEREQRKAAVAERMSDNAVRARLREAPQESTDEVEFVAGPRRRTPELLLGLLLVVAGALGGLFLFQRGEEVITVVGSARALPRGTTLAPSDLVALEIGDVPPMSAVSAADAGSLVGRRLVVDLPAGVPVSAYVVTTQRPLTPSEALIPIALEKGAVPSGLGPGDIVRITISFPNRGVDAPLPEVLADQAEVHDIQVGDEFDDEVRITVRAAADMAVDLARAERIQLMKVTTSP
jgi:hypothetical protein